MKIIPSNRKREALIRELHHFNSRFSCVMDLKVKLMDQFGTQVPATTTFNVGYFEGRQSMKMWVCSQDDLDKMYLSFESAKKRDILLWCDGYEDGSNQKKDTSTKQADREAEIDRLVDELKEIHSDEDYTEPQYRLWARMIQNGIHVSKQDPPRIPLITGVAPAQKKRKRMDDVEQTIISTASALVKAAFNPSQVSTTQSPSFQQTVIASTSESQPSPGKAAEIRGKCLSQLSVLKRLFDDDVLTEEELKEQKSEIFRTLRKLN